MSAGFFVSFYFYQEHGWKLIEHPRNSIPLPWTKNSNVSVNNESRSVASGLLYCSDEYFANFSQHHHTMPEKVSWTGNKFFKPEDCSFKDPNISQCLKHRKIKNIVVIGDSQGLRYTRALIGLFKSQGVKCAQDSQRSSESPLDFFARKRAKGLKKQLESHAKQPCTSCYCLQASCSYHSQPLSVEYFALTLMNESIVVLPPHDGSDLEASNYEEFLLRVYLKDAFPDLVVMFVPLNHMKHRSFEEFNASFVDFVKTFKKMQKPSSHIYFITAPAENESRKNSKWKNVKFHGYLGTDKIYLMTKDLYRLLEPDLLQPHSNFHTFVNLVNASMPLMNTSPDGIHYGPSWYSAVVSAIFGSMCEGA